MVWPCWKWQTRSLSVPHVFFAFFLIVKGFFTWDYPILDRQSLFNSYTALILEKDALIVLGLKIMKTFFSVVVAMGLWKFGIWNQEQILFGILQSIGKKSTALLGIPPRNATFWGRLTPFFFFRRKNYSEACSNFSALELSVFTHKLLFNFYIG